MTSNEAYLNFIIKLNRNYGTDNVTVDKQTFVIAYNENQIKFFEGVLDKKNDDDIRDAQQILVKGKQINTISDKDDDCYCFKLPSDYLEISSAYALATKGKCKNRKIYLWEIKDQNTSEILSDEFNKPSFDFEESPFTLSNNNICIHVNDFKINVVYLSYYRYPINIDIDGYINQNNENSVNIDPEFDDKIVNRIISMTVEDIHRNYQNQLGVALNKDRIINNN